MRFEVSELAQRFSLSSEHVRLYHGPVGLALNRWPSPPTELTRFPPTSSKSATDWDDEANDDSTYRADFSNLPQGVDDPLTLYVA